MTIQDEALAAYAIGKILARYAHGVDRCDIEVLKSVYWPDATDNHGIFSGNALEFADFIIPFNLQLDHTMHRICNIEVDLLSPTRARVQSSFMTYHEHGDEQSRIGGRYLDLFEQRDGEWRIKDRMIVMDWNETIPSTANWGPGSVFSPVPQGGRQPEDPYYQWIRTYPDAAQREG